MSREILVNPSPGALGTHNAIVAGRARRYEVSQFAGPLSVKSVVAGRATWESAAGRFDIPPGTALIVHDAEEYSMEVDALHPVETFCVFFSRRWIDDAFRSTVLSSDSLLDAAPRWIPRFERLHHGAVANVMASAQRKFAKGLFLEEAVVQVASVLAASQLDARQRIARLPAARMSTREELLRRVARATDYIHANFGSSLPLDDIAASACLSPFHLHRVFSAVHGVTPHRYITQLRLSRARSLLLHTADSVLDVALQCGFESVTSFTTLFRREYGAPPARFRKIREDGGSAAR